MAATDPRVETLRLLQSIDQRLETLVRMLSGFTLNAAATNGTVPDVNLDGNHGDPVLKFTPRDWTGDSFKGRNFSECPPELLDLVANALNYFADKSDDPKKQKFDRLDARRAAAWAARIRGGWKPPATPATPPEEAGF